jgi:hypothetical protein
MARFDQKDIILELIELCRELKDEIYHQLNYYRASVYKDETAKIINAKLDQLKMLIKLFGDDELLDYFQDFEVSRQNGNVALPPGECLLSKRISELFQQLDPALRGLTDMIQSQQNPYANDHQFAKSIKRHRRQLLAMCRPGSRQRAFFQTL